MSVLSELSSGDLHAAATGMYTSACSMIVQCWQDKHDHLRPRLFFCRLFQISSTQLKMMPSTIVQLLWCPVGCCYPVDGHVIAM